MTEMEIRSITTALADPNGCHRELPMPPRSTRPAAIHWSTTLPKPRLLVVDDSPVNRFVIADFLRKEPYEIDFAENGRLAVERFGAQSYDLVLMDIQMPEMDGLEATRLIRQWESEHDLGHTPVIALTASVLKEDVKKALAVGCDQYFSKPIKKGILIEALRNMTPPPRDPHLSQRMV